MKTMHVITQEPQKCWPQMGPMLAPWTLLSGMLLQCGVQHHVKLNIGYSETQLYTLVQRYKSVEIFIFK